MLDAQFDNSESCIRSHQILNFRVEGMWEFLSIPATKMYRPATYPSCGTIADHIDQTRYRSGFIL